MTRKPIFDGSWMVTTRLLTVKKSFRQEKNGPTLPTHHQPRERELHLVRHSATSPAFLSKMCISENIGK